jgi:hypothetical protein
LDIKAVAVSAAAVKLRTREKAVVYGEPCTLIYIHSVARHVNIARISRSVRMDISRPTVYNAVHSDQKRTVDRVRARSRNIVVVFTKAARCRMLSVSYRKVLNSHVLYHSAAALIIGSYRNSVNSAAVAR